MTATKVLLFGKLRSYVPDGEITVALSPEVMPSQFREVVAQELKKRCATFPGVGELTSCAVASDRILRENEPIGTVTELALLPPVCGG